MEKLLVVVDYQKDFVDGVLGFPKAKEIEPAIAHLIKHFEENGNEVVFTRDVHSEDYLHTEEGRNLPIPHCIKGSEGAEIYGSIKELSKGHLVFDKEDNTFGSNGLYAYLRKRSFRTIALCGVDGSICVLANAVICKTAQPEAHIEVMADGIADDNEEALAHAYEALKRIHVEILYGELKNGGLF